MADPIILDVTKTAQDLAGGQKSFVQRLINLQIKLGSPTTSQPGTFVKGPGAGAASVTLSGHRVSARITQTGSAAGEATVHVYGVDQSTMNEMSQLGLIYDQIRQNQVIISAGDRISGMTPIYGGDTIMAYVDYNQQPEVPLVFVIRGGLSAAVVNTLPTSFSGVTTVEQLMQGWATLMGLTLENNGVSQKLSNPYYSGNTWAKIKKAAEDANINAEVFVANQTLAIWPKGGSRAKLTTVPIISKDTGMIGYPGMLSPNGTIVVKHIFNPLVQFGGTIEVRSSILPTSRWDVWKLEHHLDSLVPGGDWMGIAYCYPHGVPPPPPIPAGGG